MTDFLLKIIQCKHISQRYLKDDATVCACKIGRVSTNFAKKLLQNSTLLLEHIICGTVKWFISNTIFEVYFEWEVTLGSLLFSHNIDFLAFVSEKRKLVQPCLTPSTRNNHNAAKSDESYLLTVPKIF